MRVGYISSELRQHALGLNLLPVFAHHDKSQFEIFCYSSVVTPDFYTFRFRQCADQWRDVQGGGITGTPSDSELAELIRKDQIDILIDLHQHMSGTRLPLFARKPAPVQIAFAGYPGTTGLATIDYRLTDPYLDPPEPEPQQPRFEIALRLPHSFWCYQPVIELLVNERAGVIRHGHLWQSQQFLQAQRIHAESVGQSHAGRARFPAYFARDRRDAPPTASGHAGKTGNPRRPREVLPADAYRH